MKVLLIGGTGKVGVHILRELGRTYDSNAALTKAQHVRCAGRIDLIPCVARPVIVAVQAGKKEQHRHLL